MPVLTRLLLTLLLAAMVTVAPASPEMAVGAETLQAGTKIRFVTEGPESAVKVHAKFPRNDKVCEARQQRDLHSAYRGVVEIGRRGNGRLYMVAELSFPEYLGGIAEVPRNWPLESLKAQVVAARTYAISHMNPSSDAAREIGFDLCATDACQVFRGLGVERGAWGEQWTRAVNETSGEILEHEGKPANTFYFSTSNGQTYTNGEVFGGTNLPYLKPVTETDDTGSPVSSWNVRMSFDDLAESLRLAGSWPGGSIDSVSQEGDSVRIRGSGREASLTVDELRRKLNAFAVCLTPKRYPTRQPNGRLYPQVVPSKWMTLKTEGREVVMDGRGWGHGVGMVQWGAKGKADRGMSYSDILSFYYGGLKPVRRSEPGRIRVALATDIEQITVERVGSVRVEGAQIPEGPVLIRGGTEMRTEQGGPIAPVLKLTNAAVTLPSVATTTATFNFELSDPARVRLNYSGPAEGVVELPFERGPQVFSWDTRSLPAGDYQVRLAANDGVDEVSSDPFAVPVLALPPPSPSPVPVPRAAPDDGLDVAWVAGTAAAAAAAAAIAIVLLRKRRLRNTRLE